APRPGPRPRHSHLAGGRAARLAAHAPLAPEQWLVVAEATGHAASARVTTAAPISEEEALSLGRLVTEETAIFDPTKGTFSARRRRQLGAITLSETPLPAPKGEMAVKAHLDAVMEHGFSILPAHNIIEETKARVCITARATGVDIMFDDQLLMARLEDWLPPLLGTPPQFIRLTAAGLRQALLALLDWDVTRSLQEHAPLAHKSPAGRELPIDYLAEGGPAIEGRVQEFFGLKTHPHIGRGQVPLTISLTSPAKRPVAVTKDLPGFWSAGYRDMVKDMRGRYPKHDWPDDPSTASPHEGRTKARLNR
ncbi:MAG: ATP-dependent helicase C-terminal domain-containing protein, partial [Pseudomonadota bacterium]